ncbi:MAG: galactose-1-phosphate uridylyltransferase [Nitrospirota bacterium]
MPELRKDPVNNRWVIVATERAKRPSDFKSKGEKEKKEIISCPFCEGNESKTPPEILSYRKQGTLPNTPGWWLRVVPNKYPALQIEGALVKKGQGMFDTVSGTGAHEVIIETPEHELDFASLEIGRVEETLWAYRDRSIDLNRDPRFEYILIFKNHGVAAGASLEHPHSQLIATPIVPSSVREEMEGALQYFKYKDRCVFCDIIREEKESNERIIMENEDFIALAPFASRFPFECWILPKVHDATFPDITRHEVMALAEVLGGILKKMNKTLNNPPFNYMLHTAPCKMDASQLKHYHWHIELIPRLTDVAGFEWGSGVFINPTPPEEAAKYLREEQDGQP